MFEIIPGILEKDWGEIKRKIELVRPYVETIHIDIIDGKFANNITFLDPQPFKGYTDELFFELHMMVDEPVNYLESWAAAGFKRFLGHIERMSNQANFVAKGQLLGEVGLALDGPTELERMMVPYDDLDVVLIYTASEAGFSGPALNLSRLDKIKKLREKTTLPIEVDGGIDQQTIVDAKKAGASRFVSTSFLFESNNIQNAINQLKASV